MSFLNEYFFYSNKYCKVCLDNKSSSYICNDCLERLEFISSKRELDEGVCYYPLFYNNYLKNIIKRFKYNNDSHLVHPLSEILYKFYLSLGISFDYVTYVPMYSKDEYDRGFNQSYVLAKYFSKKTGIDLISIAKKSRATRHQNKLDRLERKTNLSKSIDIIENLNINGKRILVIDDLVTTGATLNVLSSEIKKSYNIEVSFLTLASSKIDSEEE